LKKKKIYI